MTTIRRLV